MGLPDRCPPIAGGRGRQLAALALTLGTLAYPFAVWLGATYGGPGLVATLLGAVALLRAATARGAEARGWWWAAGGALLLALAAWWAHDWLPLKLYPVLVNATLLTLFGASLWRGPPVIERLARLRTPDLPPEAQRYTRRVTQVWCGFFALNGTVALATALWADTATWTLYNGFIAYVLMGLLLGGEWLLRPKAGRA